MYYLVVYTGVGVPRNASGVSRGSAKCMDANSVLPVTCNVYGCWSSISLISISPSFPHMYYLVVYTGAGLPQNAYGVSRGSAKCMDSNSGVPTTRGHYGCWCPISLIRISPSFPHMYYLVVYTGAVLPRNAYGVSRGSAKCMDGNSRLPVTRRHYGCWCPISLNSISPSFLHMY